MLVSKAAGLTPSCTRLSRVAGLPGGAASEPRRGWRTNEAGYGALPVGFPQRLCPPPGRARGVRGTDPAHCEATASCWPSGAPLPGVPRSRGTQTAGRTWRARPGVDGRGRRGPARGGRRGAATAPGPPASRRWAGKAEERVNSDTRSANFSNWVGKGAATDA